MMDLVSRGLIVVLFHCVCAALCLESNGQLIGLPSHQLIVDSDPNRKNRDVSLNDGFQVSADIIVLRARASELDRDRSIEALNKLGGVAMDRVTVELLKSIARTPDALRRYAAAEAMIEIAERAVPLGHREFGGLIGEDIYLSSHADDLRDRAYDLFMLLDTDRARRHRDRNKP